MSDHIIIEVKPIEQKIPDHVMYKHKMIYGVKQNKFTSKVVPIIDTKQESKNDEKLHVTMYNSLDDNPFTCKPVYTKSMLEYTANETKKHIMSIKSRSRVLLYPSSRERVEYTRRKDPSIYIDATDSDEPKESYYV